MAVAFGKDEINNLVDIITCRLLTEPPRAVLKCTLSLCQHLKRGPERRDVRSRYAPTLQSNKVRQAMELANAIHTVDRPKLAKAIARIAQETGSCPELFIQVNTGEEPQKAGIAPKETDQFVAECRELDLPIVGLMCIPPIEEEPSLHFALLAKIAERNGLSGLSMGMSSDFERAIALGATHIRVGSAIFGERVPK